MIRRNFALHVAALSIATLVLGTSAWADITGTIWRVDGNNNLAGPNSIQGTGVGKPNAVNEGTFTAPAVDFNILDGQASTDPLSDFLSTATSTTPNPVLGANQPMSGEKVAGTGSPDYNSGNASGPGNTCFDNTGSPLKPTNSSNCYSTVVEISGNGTFALNQLYTISHDDGVQLFLGATQLTDCGGGATASTPGCLYNSGKPAEDPTSDANSTFVGSGYTGDFTIWYMATNGNPDRLDLNPNVPAAEPGTISMLLTMLAGVGFFSMKKRFA